MSTVIRPEVSNDSKYYISKHRYYELKHFCLQYKDWQRQLVNATYISSSSVLRVNQLSTTDKTSDLAIIQASLSHNCKLVEDTAKTTDAELSPYILKAVTEGYSYVYLSTMLNIPCSKGTFYERYRKFFWLLSKERL